MILSEINEKIEKTIYFAMLKKVVQKFLDPHQNEMGSSLVRAPPLHKISW